MSGRAQEWARKHADEVRQLVDMGFEEGAATDALYRTRNLERAAELLVAGGIGDDDDDGRVEPRGKARGKDGGGGLAPPERAPTYAVGDYVRVKSKTRGWVEGTVKRRDANADNETLIFVAFRSSANLAGRWLPAAAAYVRPAALGGRIASGNLDDAGSLPPGGALAAPEASRRVAAPAPAEPASPPPASPPPPPPPPERVESPFKPVAPPRDPEQVALEPGMFVDVRDSIGKWLEAEVLRVSGTEAQVHFLRWDSKWDEWICREKERYRFAPFHLYSAGSEVTAYEKGDKVFVYPPALVPRTWVEGEVRRKDGPQMQIQFEVKGRKHQYWFHVDSDEIAGEDGPEEEPDADKTPDGKWFVGQYIEVLDTVNKWLPASVLRVSGFRIFVHYENWSSRWDEWLDVKRDRARLRGLGDAIEPSKEEKLKKEEEERFRAQLESDHGFRVVDSEKDGNCLFRSVAHQIYNDPELHARVRKDCYDYMERDREFFSMYVGEDFDEYLARQRKPNEWGDHVEVVALREMYNKNVEVYDKDSVRAPKPLGLTSEEYSVPVIRLSYHGSNHYNSVVDPRAPPPLGDGRDSAVRLRDRRLAEMQKEAEAAAARAPPPAAASPSPAPADGAEQQRYRERSLSKQRQRDLMRPVQKNAVPLTRADFEAAWRDVAGDGSASSAPAEEAPSLVRSLITALFRKKHAQRKKAGVETESLQKRFDDAKTDVTRHARSLVAAQPDRSVLGKEVSRSYVLGDLALALEWAFNK